MPGPTIEVEPRGSGADLGPQRAPRIDGHPLARPGNPRRHGRRARPDPAAARARPVAGVRVHPPPERHLLLPLARRNAGRNGDGRACSSSIPGLPTSRASIATSPCSIQEWAILPGSTIPNTMSMEFNLFTINGRAAPYVTPLVCKLGERVRIRLVNFGAIDHHPMHLHGLTFFVTGTEGGRIQPSGLGAGQHRAGGGGAGARDRVHRQQPRRLDAALPHVPPRDELHELDGRPDGGPHGAGHAGGPARRPAGMGIATGGPALSDAYGRAWAGAWASRPASSGPSAT